MTFRYESLEVWPLALEYVDACFIVADALPQRVQFSIGEQLRRAATSIIANIAEGSGKTTSRSERNFYDIARGSVAETVGLLALCQRRNYLLPDRHQRMYNRANVVSAMLWGLIKANDDRISETPTFYQADNHSLDDILNTSFTSLLASSPPASSRPRLLVVGLTGGADSLPPALVARIMAADLLAGGKRQLSYFPDFVGEKLAIAADMETVVQRLQQAWAAGEQAVVLASGDPLCYGIGATLRRYFPAEALEIIPAPTAFQLAFAALAEPWAGAALLSAHARPLATVVSGVLAAPKAAILTDPQQHTPAVVAEALLAAGLPLDTPCAICENLGNPAQRIVRTVLGRVSEEMYASLNVLVVWNTAREQGSRGAGEGNYQPSNPSTSLRTSLPTFQPTNPPGLPDDAFSTSVGQITKREIRLLALAELALGPGEVLWDIGAGSGAVSIEAARSQPEAAVYAVEKRAELSRHFQENLRRFPAANLHWVEGVAPEATHDWPAPHAVFVGGSDKKLPEIIETARQRLHHGGRLVINLATLENLYTARVCLPAARVTQVQISRGTPILDMLRFEALNPVFMVTWQKGRDDS
jgi:precorrin-6Y C5,15-methyltransferase (decarboxylating)